ncbi:MAG TPA: SDR family NAD(P)-dependent oxidoreductase [Caldimonas sp.]|nr:SDR family NAD(P)-dependent oxidoreductase [Caldimonas sp.]
MSSHLFIVTGASRGMGAAIAGQLLDRPDTVLLGISRRDNPGLAERARASGSTVLQWPTDLADPLAAAARLRAWLDAQDGIGFATASLVNNAAALTRIGALEDCNAEELSRAVRVGLEAPLLLMAAFLGATAKWPGRRRVLNISSGLGRRAMAGQASYCATKAGLDHLSRAAALDQAQQTRGATVVSLAPGVIDTDMQSELRAARGDGFPERDNFVRLKEDGGLASPDEAAARVIAWLERADFGTSPVADVRDA